MIELSSIYKYYGERCLLENASFCANKGERIGIVGPNGAGKSTLFRMIIGEVAPDRGSVRVQKDLRIGHLRQIIEANKNETLLGFALQADPRLEQLQATIHRLEAELRNRTSDQNALLNRIGNLQSEFEHLGGYQLENRVKTGLTGLGFDPNDFDRPFDSFSGGWQMRAELARVLAGVPDVLLLDEPSNYLDIPAVEWLHRRLANFQGTLLLISHDRYLLQTLIQQVLEVSAGRFTRYATGYEEYLVERMARLEQRIAAWQSQERKIQKIQKFIDRFRSKSSLATRVQSRVKMLAKLERVPEPEEESAMTLVRLPDPPHSGSETLRLEGMSFGYNSERLLIHNFDLRVRRGEKIAIVGYNGMGKTTLIRLMAGFLQPIAGRRVLGHHVVIGYQSQEFAETLPAEKSAYDVVRAAAGGRMADRELRGLLGSFGFGGEAADKLVGVLSGGEKIRLSFARIFADPPNFLLLDEPTTHLDLDAREALEGALNDFPGTVVLVSHDVVFTRNIAQEILEVSPMGIQRFLGGYDEYLEAVALRSKIELTPENAQRSSAAKRFQNRNELKRQARRLERTMADTEAEIQKVEAEQEILTTELNTATGKTVSEISTQLAGLHEKLTQLMATWEESAMALEEIRLD